MTYSTSVYGSTENFVQYLKYGKLCSTDNSGMLTLTTSKYVSDVSVHVESVVGVQGALL